MIPIFDSMGASKSYKFQISMTKRDMSAIRKVESGETFTRLEQIEYRLAKLKSRLNSYFNELQPEEIVFFL